MRYAYYTIIQIKIPFQDDVSFEDQKKKRPGDRPFSKQRIPSSARPKPDVAYLAHYPFVHRNIYQIHPWYSLDAPDHLYLILLES